MKLINFGQYCIIIFVYIIHPRGEVKKYITQVTKLDRLRYQSQYTRIT